MTPIDVWVVPAPPDDLDYDLRVFFDEYEAQEYADGCNEALPEDREDYIVEHMVLMNPDTPSPGVREVNDAVVLDHRLVLEPCSSMVRLRDDGCRGVAWAIVCIALLFFALTVL